MYLREERCNDRPSHLLLSLQLNLNQNWTPTANTHGSTHSQLYKTCTTIIKSNLWLLEKILPTERVCTSWCCPFLPPRRTARCWGSGWRSEPRRPSERLRAAAKQFCLHPPSPWCRRYSPHPDEKSRDHVVSFNVYSIPDELQMHQVTKQWCTLSVQRLMCSEVKKGSCLRYESLDHMACVTICASSIAARAGLSQPLLDSTSTQAWISRIACKCNTRILNM